MKKSCPHCGSQFVRDLGVVQSQHKDTHRYFCESCKAPFEEIIPKMHAEGKWLMTMSGNSTIPKQNSMASTTIAVFIDNRAPGLLTCDIRRSAYPYGPGPTFWTDRTDLTLRISKDNGWRIKFSTTTLTDFILGQVYLNDELTQNALSCDAMRACHSGKGNTFHLPKQRTGQAQLDRMIVEGVCDWLEETLNSYTGGNIIRSKNDSTGCYVATCVYGSYDCPEVWTLRRFRDEYLTRTWLGRSFIRFYYRVSPSLVEKHGQKVWFRCFCQALLDKLVKKLQSKGIESSPYQDIVW